MWSSSYQKVPGSIPSSSGEGDEVVSLSTYYRYYSFVFFLSFFFSFSFQSLFDHFSLVFIVEKGLVLV